jgi:hypothetical protein
MVRSSVAAIVAAALTALSCGPSPASPSSSAHASLNTPKPQSPIGGVSVPSLNGGIYLVVQNVAADGTAPVLIVVEVSPSPAFDSPYDSSRTVPQADGGTTTIPLDGYLGISQDPTPFYWRVHAVAGERISATSSVQKFVLLADASGPQANPGVPILVSPASGATQNGDGAFTVRAPDDAGWIAGYQIQVSPSSSFDRGVVSCEADAIFGVRDTPCALLRLDTGAYYWRAQAIAHSGLGLSQSPHGPFSAPVPFNVVNETIGIPTIVSPALDSESANPATITVTNVTRKGTVGPMAYDFALWGGDSADPTAIISAARVPEDSSGRTSWNVPVELGIGQKYWIRVIAVDSATGAAGFRIFGFLTIVSTDAVPLTMQVHLPSGTGLCGGTFQFPVTADGDLGFGPVTITSGFQLRMTLQRRFGETVVGTIEGSTDKFAVSGSSSSTVANVTGDLTGHNQASGTFDGSYRALNSFDGVPCSTTGANWSLVPR